MTTPSEAVWANIQDSDYYLRLRADRLEQLHAARNYCWRKWQGCCAICRRDFGAIRMRMTLDHILPKSRGGTDEHENLRPLCFRCHSELNRHGQCVGSLLMKWMMDV